VTFARVGSAEPETVKKRRDDSSIEQASEERRRIEIAGCRTVDPGFPAVLSPIWGPTVFDEEKQ